MQPPERLDKQAAETDWQAMLIVLGGITSDPTKASAVDYDYAASQLNKIQRNLASLSDDEIITLHSKSVKLSEQEPDSEPHDNACHLYEDTLNAMAYLDPERAVACYQRILDREDVEPATSEFVPFGLIRLTRVIDEGALPLWEQVFEHRFGVRECATLAADKVLSNTEAFPVSEQTAARLRVLMN